MSKKRHYESNESIDNHYNDVQNRYKRAYHKYTPDHYNHDHHLNGDILHHITAIPETIDLTDTDTNNNVIDSTLHNNNNQSKYDNNNNKRPITSISIYDDTSDTESYHNTSDSLNKRSRSEQTTPIYSSLQTTTYQQSHNYDHQYNSSTANKATNTLLHQLHLERMMRKIDVNKNNSTSSTTTGTNPYNTSWGTNIKDTMRQPFSASHITNTLGHTSQPTIINGEIRSDGDRSQYRHNYSAPLHRRNSHDMAE